jgi:general secretion pathway protein N
MTMRGPAIALSILMCPLLATPSLAQQQNQAIGSVGDLLGLPPIQDMRATRERPLFTPTRRPPPPEPREQPRAAVAPSPPPPQRLELIGIVSGNDVGIAVLRALGTNDVRRLRKGESFGEWTLVEIEPKSVLLRRQGQSHRLTIFNTGKN